MGTGIEVAFIPRAFPSSTDDPVLLLNVSVFFCFFFSVFFFQEITKLRKYYTRFSLAKGDDQPVAFASLIHLMSEKRDWGTPLSKSLLMAIHVQAWGSLCDPTTNHKITLAPFNF